MTSSQLAREVFALVEAKVLSRPSPVEFEMAYQARIAIEKIRFAIKEFEHLEGASDSMREASFQLLDAIDRLQSAEQRFQRRWRGRRADENEKISAVAKASSNS